MLLQKMHDFAHAICNIKERTLLAVVPKGYLRATVAGRREVLHSAINAKIAWNVVDIVLKY